MPEKSGFFDSTAGDMREYPARDFAEYFARFVTNGVFNGGQYLNPTASGQDANIFLSPGYAWINGYVYSIYDSPVVLSIEPAAALDRIDRIILRLDTSTPVRSIRALVVQGLPASNPTPPVLIRSGNIYDLSIAQVRVLANSTIITQANITDERLNQDVCGLVNSLIRVDTAAFQAQWDAFMQSVQDQGFVTQQQLTTKLAEKTNLNDYVRQPAYAATSGTATAYTVSLTPAPTILPEGFGIIIVPHVDCGANPTLKIGNLAAVPLKDQKGAAFAAGKLLAGKPYTFRKVGSDFLAVSGSGGGDSSGILPIPAFATLSGYSLENAVWVEDNILVGARSGSIARLVTYNASGTIIGNLLIQMPLSTGETIYSIILFPTKNYVYALASIDPNNTVRICKFNHQGTFISSIESLDMTYLYRISESDGEELLLTIKTGSSNTLRLYSWNKTILFTDNPVYATSSNDGNYFISQNAFVYKYNTFENYAATKRGSNWSKMTGSTGTIGGGAILAAYLYR
ncbi:hypothetical protein J41TS12_41530 [Paenibacillus antibioticophila]|uniref:Uncharacterized protein n=1 Tax=Paenibacillus antibioticophila TaxID=1274374 RepID=A0A919XZ63_9BACL|nr:hypothetical protein [Paenibacillus antibioticophila]GIO39292.1 hypothetical protein J41TS12_41530 [Paenibacillus antibioticophila]